MGAQRLLNLINKFEALESGKMEDIINVALDQQSDKMLELNKDQLEAGINSLGQSIKPPYTAFTVAQKIRKGQPFDKVTLFDKGNFYYGMEVQTYKDKREIVSNDWKEEMLKEKYGEEIEGLTDEHVKEVQQEMVPSIQQQIKSYFKV